MTKLKTQIVPILNNLNSDSKTVTKLKNLNGTTQKGGLKNFPLFLLKGNEILPMTPKAGCASGLRRLI